MYDLNNSFKILLKIITTKEIPHRYGISFVVIIILFFLSAATLLRVVINFL